MPQMSLVIHTVLPEPLLLTYSKTCLKWPLKKKTKIGFQDRLSLNAGQNIAEFSKGEHSAILTTFIKLPLCFVYFRAAA